MSGHRIQADGRPEIHPIRAAALERSAEADGRPKIHPIRAAALERAQLAAVEAIVLKLACRLERQLEWVEAIAARVEENAAKLARLEQGE